MAAENKNPEIRKFVENWKRDLDEKQTEYVRLAESAQVKRDDESWDKARQAMQELTDMLALKDREPPEGWQIIDPLNR